MPLNMKDKVLNFKPNSQNKTAKFEMKNASATKAEIIIYGAIGDDFWDDAAVSAKKFSDELDKLPKTVNEISVRINSPGGSVFDGITIYERLKQHSAKVIVYVDGVAASIASIIAMAGDEIIIGDGSFFMIHKPWTYAVGNSKDLEDTVMVLNSIENRMVNIYSKKTGMSKEEIILMLADDTWIDSDKAKDMGFATSIAEASENLRFAASMVKSAKWLAKTNQPKIADTKLVKNKIQALKDQLKTFNEKKK